MNQKLIIGLIIESIGALGCILLPIIAIMKFNKWILLGVILSFVMLVVGLFITMSF